MYGPGERAYSRCCVRRLQGVTFGQEESRKLGEFVKHVKDKPYDKDLAQWFTGFTKGQFGESTIDTSEYFCSEIVADAYKTLGLLDADVDPATFIPKDFSSSTFDLLGRASLGPLIEVSLDQSSSWRQSLHQMGKFETDEDKRGVPEPGFTLPFPDTVDDEAAMLESAFEAAKTLDNPSSWQQAIEPYERCAHFLQLAINRDVYYSTVDRNKMQQLSRCMSRLDALTKARNSGRAPPFR